MAAIVASLAMVVVLPTPVGPTSPITFGPLAGLDDFSKRANFATALPSAPIASPPAKE